MEFKLIQYWEHYNDFIEEDLNRFEKSLYSFPFPKIRGEGLPCFEIIKNSEEELHLKTNYFIGVDWVVKNETAIYIASKLNSKHYDINIQEHHYEIDFIKMLYSTIRNIDISKHIDDLILVKWDEPKIEISQKQDLLTPFLIVEFLEVVKKIVKKGLKKSYYKIEDNLNSRVKGKIRINKNVKQNLARNKNHQMICEFEEYGIHHVENILIKKALNFITRYLPIYSKINDSSYLTNLLNFISPAFQSVVGDIEISEIRHLKRNSFYKEYDNATRLAKLILERFGYNISNTVNTKIKTPPFWIDMSKLFEIYILGKLKEVYKNQIEYQFKDYGNELDFILNTDKYKLVVDAKYKLKYLYGKYDEDARQISGYSRLESVYKYLDKKYPESIDCLIIHPDQENGIIDFENIILNEKRIPSYLGIYKIGIKLPII